MNLSKKLGISLVAASILGSYTVCSAQEVSIAPPPVSADTILSKGGSQQTRGISFLSYSSDAFDMTGVGFNLGSKNKNADGMIFEPSLGFGFIYGENDSGTLEMSNFSMDLSAMIGKKAGPLTVFAGPALNLTTISTTMYYTQCIGFSCYETSDTTSSSMTLAGLAYGLQLDIPTGFGLFTPFYVQKSLSGSVETDTTSTDVDLDISQLGFDMYFKSIGTSLSAMAQSDDDGDLLYFSYNWKFKSK